MSSLSSDESFAISSRDDVKIESDLICKEKGFGKRKLESPQKQIVKRLANIKREHVAVKKEALTLRVFSPSECACHDVIDVEIYTQFPKMSFKRTNAFPQQLQFNGIYFESEEVDPSYVLLIELTSKVGERDFQLLQHCEKCKDKRDGKEIITANSNTLVSNSKGSISLSISLHEQSAHLDPSYTGGKIKENMKIYVQATLFLVVENSLQTLESNHSEGIKVVAQGKLKNRQVKQERNYQLAHIKQDTEKFAALVNTKHQTTLLSEIAMLRDRCSSLEDKNQFLETNQEMLEKKSIYLEEKLLQMEELIGKFLNPGVPNLIALQDIQAQSSPFIDASTSSEFLMATVNGLDNSPTSGFDFLQNLPH